MSFIPTVPEGFTVTPDSDTSLLLEWFASIDEFSTRIAIAAGNICEWHGDQIPTKARLYATKTFTASDFTIVLAGSEELNPDAFQEFSLTLIGSTVRIETGTAYATTDSDRPDVTYNLDAFNADGQKLFNILTGLRIPPEADPTTWDAIKLYSTAIRQLQPATYLDSNAILGLLSARAPIANPVFSGRVIESTSIAVNPSATPVIDASLGDAFTLTPSEDEDISIQNMAAGQNISLLISTSGTTSRALTFGTNFKASGVLNTGVVSGKYFLVKFWSNGTFVFEVNRTGAL